MPNIDPLTPLMMVGLYRLGCNVSWIARLMDCSRGRVYRQLRILIKLSHSETTGRPKREPLSQARKNEVRILAEAGISAIDIAHAMEIDLPTVLMTISEKKVKRRPCLHCEAMTPDWICKKCKRRQKEAG